MNLEEIVPRFFDFEFILILLDRIYDQLKQFFVQILGRFFGKLAAKFERVSIVRFENFENIEYI